MRVRRALSVLAAVISLALGVFGALGPDQRRSPAWADRVAAAVDAPIPAGSRVGLLAPPGLAAEDRDRLLFELAWQRPDLLWSVPAPGDADVLVAFGPAGVPAGWRSTWSRGEIVLLTRAGP